MIGGVGGGHWRSLWQGAVRYGVDNAVVASLLSLCLGQCASGDPVCTCSCVLVCMRVRVACVDVCQRACVWICGVL